jgi:hypothetical protein
MGLRFKTQSLNLNARIENLNVGWYLLLRYGKYQSKARKIFFPTVRKNSQSISPSKGIYLLFLLNSIELLIFCLLQWIEGMVRFSDYSNRGFEECGFFEIF